MLVAAGYHTVTPAQVAAWHAGHAPLPPNAVLLTFDGGRMDTTLNAAPIVAHLHMRATVFVIGGAYRQAPVFYASPDQLRSLQNAGLVDRGARDLGARLGPGRARQAAPLPGGAPHARPHRSRRCPSSPPASEPTTSTRRPRPRRSPGAPVIAFSWPFGAYGADQRTNDPATAAINVGLARTQFALGFNDDGQETYTLAARASDPLRISRLRVDPTLTPRALFARLELAIAASGTIGRPHA